MDRIAHIPGVIVQGRYDVVCPPVTDDALARIWPEADYVIVPAIYEGESYEPLLGWQVEPVPMGPQTYHMLLNGSGGSIGAMASPVTSAQHARCGAHSRRTQRPCQAPALTFNRQACSSGSV